MEELAKSEKILLIKLARQAIEKFLRERRLVWEVTQSEALKQPGGAFVSLHMGGELRGCIGRLEAVDSLEKVVQEMAVAAATKDYRFSPVSLEEVESLEIEISVLSPFQVVKNIEEIIIGRHGLMIREGEMSGLLLPQVASKEGWDVATFLSHTCLKAGLPADFWKTGRPKIEAFSADVFSEKELI